MKEQTFIDIYTQININSKQVQEHGVINVKNYITQKRKVMNVNLRKTRKQNVMIVRFTLKKTIWKNNKSYYHIDNHRKKKTDEFCFCDINYV